MARSGKYLYYCNGSGTYCTPLYDSTECLACGETYKSHFTVKNGEGTYYVPIFDGYPNTRVEGEPYLRYNSCYLAQSNGFLAAIYYEYDKGPAEILDRCTWEACGTAKRCTLDIEITTRGMNGLANQKTCKHCIPGYIPIMNIDEDVEENRRATKLGVARCTEYYAWSAYSSTHTGTEGGAYWARVLYRDHPEKRGYCCPYLYLDTGNNPYTPSSAYTTLSFRCVCITPYRLKVSEIY